MDGNEHDSIIICGYLDAGRRTLIGKSVPVILLSDCKSNNFIQKSKNMGSLKGCNVLVGRKKMHIDIPANTLETNVKIPQNDDSIKRFAVVRV